MPHPAPIVLVVEDDELVRDLACTLLNETGLDVMSFDSAEAAVAVLESRAEDVAMVFTDVNLAGSMDGIALAHTVGRQWPRISLVVTSGGEVATAQLPEAAVYMPKPWLPLNVLVQAGRAVRTPQRLAA